jgi:alpha-beta hydrolase superfamily lysophospholipase
MLHTKDNIDIAYEHYKNGSDSVIIVCPGFYNSKDNRWMRKTVDIISSTYDVIIFDFRGHGVSGGKFTWSAKERMDVDAVVDYAAACGYKHIGIIAFSLGAAAAVNSAAGRGDIDSMVLISCPSRFKTIDYHFWEREMFADLMDNIECKWQGKGARVSSMFLVKKDPIDSISLIKKTAILFIHGDKDWVIKAYHSQKLYEAARIRKKLEIIKGGLHAERLIQFHAGMMKELMLDWFSKTLHY